MNVIRIVLDWLRTDYVGAYMNGFFYVRRLFQYLPRGTNNRAGSTSAVARIATCPELLVYSLHGAFRRRFQRALTGRG